LVWCAEAVQGRKGGDSVEAEPTRGGPGQHMQTDCGHSKFRIKYILINTINFFLDCEGKSLKGKKKNVFI
jgi:hypothetical protein